MIKSINIQEIILFAAIAIYSAVYSFVTVERYFAFNAGIFDLGVNFQLLISALPNGFFPSASTPHPFLANKLIYIVLSPIFYVFPSQELLLVIQTVWIALAALPIYLISKEYNHSKWISLGFGVSWLLYYPMAGVNWFDFHFMAMFPTFFLLGFYTHIKGKEKLSLFLMALAAITDLLVPLTLIFYSAYLYLSDIRQKKNPLWNVYSHILIAFSLSILAFVYLYQGQGYLAGQVTVVTNYAASPTQKEMYLLYMTAPLLMLSFLAPDILLISIPFLLMIFHNNYAPFVSPEFYQYPALVSPILFIAGIKGFSRLAVKHNVVDLSRLRKPLIVAFVILNLIFAAFLTPVGQLATGNNYSREFSSVMAGLDYTYNARSSITDHSYNSEMAYQLLPLVVKGHSLLLQNNMPQFMNSDYNLYLPGLMPTGFTPDYAMIDPYSCAFILPTLYQVPQNITMWNLSNQYYLQDHYGVLGETQGIVLLKKNYSGAPEIYDPYKSTFNGADFVFNAGSYVSNGITYVHNSVNNGFGWYGPGSFLVPGKYLVNVTLVATGSNVNDTSMFSVTGMSSATGSPETMAQKNITFTELGGNNVIVTISLQIDVKSFMYYVEYQAQDMNWVGDLGLIGVNVYQTSWMP